MMCCILAIVAIYPILQEERKEVKTIQKDGPAANGLQGTVAGDNVGRRFDGSYSLRGKKESESSASQKFGQRDVTTSGLASSVSSLNPDRQSDPNQSNGFRSYVENILKY